MLMFESHLIPRPTPESALSVEAPTSTISAMTMAVVEAVSPVPSSASAISQSPRPMR